MDIIHILPSLRIAERLGINVMVYAGWQGPTWTGTEIIIEQYNDFILWHELAHWYAATPRQRSIPDYGMGPNANYFGKSIQFWMKNCKSIGDKKERRWANERVNRIARYQEDMASAAILGYAVMYPTKKKETFAALRKFSVDEITDKDINFLVGYMKFIGAEVDKEVLVKLQKEYNKC